ncbi:hypothetical protein MBLNU230_g5920t1 [Neophaeotheca triangularis]
MWRQEDTKPAFGATVIPTDNGTHQNTLPPTSVSPALTPAASNDDLNDTYHTSPPPIHSPFYQHPPASFERVSYSHSRQQSFKSPTAINTTNEKDLEAQAATTPLTVCTTRGGEENPFASKYSLDYNKECKMWPSKNTLMASKLADKRRRAETRRCGGSRVKMEDAWRERSKKQKLIIKIAIAVVVCGIMVAIGVGITNAVHGGVWSGESRNTRIGGDNGDN